MKTIEKFENRTMPIAPHEMKGIKWNEMFENEKELIESILKMDDEIIKNKYQGYEYLISFRKRLSNGLELTPKQVTQLKRLSGEVYRYLWNDEHTNHRHC